MDRLAVQIRRRGLRQPALLMLYAGHPLTFLGAQTLLIAEPALSLFWPSRTLRQVAQLLEEPDAVAALAARLEQPDSSQSDRGLYD
ncbi:MAG: hypothetical protein KC425_27060 [Anaerolineales bacterium]|nr:hypothetical protein [Anaerolineales bacterium]